MFLKTFAGIDNKSVTITNFKFPNVIDYLAYALSHGTYKSGQKVKKNFAAIVMLEPL